ncbi:hypothetical protein DPMN_030909 [Dreissena polymorpha]|uniref:Hexosyltransferase n=2 Tax=Dreissena polymorpha TaxID=45954 RepID=A0A9D4LZW7_DREPO|nr:hypothetical protein DPMN_030909 [Dreissena polymorpha]
MKLSTRPKLMLILLVMTLIFLADRMIYRNGEGQDNIVDEMTKKQAEKEKTLAEIKRISQKFSAFSKKYNSQSYKANVLNNSFTVADLRAINNNPNRISNTEVSSKKTSRTNEELESVTSYQLYIEDADQLELDHPLVNLHRYEYILNNENSCKENILVLILVNIAPNKVNERDQIRNTWGSITKVSGASVVTLFVVAQTPDGKIQTQLEYESEQHRDIIQGNFLDSYRNLTIKSVMDLDWVHRFCNKTKFILKVDDDTMVDVYHLVKFLLQKSPDGNTRNFLYCSSFKNQGPVRYPDDKWFVPKHEYPYSKYPTYCEGFAYIMSYDVSMQLYNASTQVKFYWIDDVYITGFAAYKAGVRHIDMEHGHGYNMLQTEHLSKNVKSSMFLLAKYAGMRKNWDMAWNDIKSLHQLD